MMYLMWLEFIWLVVFSKYQKEYHFLFNLKTYTVSHYIHLIRTDNFAAFTSFSTFCSAPACTNNFRISKLPNQAAKCMGATPYCQQKKGILLRLNTILVI